jgi:hypothetical protein
MAHTDIQMLFIRYKRLDLTKFKTCDLVKVQVSLMGVPLKGGKVKLLMVLWALTLLDCQKSMVCSHIPISFNNMTLMHN